MICSACLGTKERGTVSDFSAMTAPSKASLPDSSQKQSKVFRVAGSWFYALVISVLAFFLGLLKTDATNQTFPRCCWMGIDYPLNPFKWTLTTDATPYVFLSFFVVWAILFSLRQIAESRQAALLRSQSRKLAESVEAVEGGTKNLQTQTTAVLTQVGKTLESANELRAKIGQIIDAVQTLPPKTFRAEFARTSGLSYSLIAKSFPRSLGSAAPEEAEFIIRLALTQLINLRIIYEENDEARYAANVMIHKDQPLDEEVMLKVRRLAPSDTIEASGLEGALVFQKQLSTSTADGPQEVDKLLPDVAFGVPVDQEDERSPWLLPGAADVYVKASKANHSYLISGNHDTHEIDNLAKTFSISEPMKTRLTDYFQKEGKMIRSYISVPLNDRGGRVFGVLNIHSSARYRSGDDKERQANFGLIIAPLVNGIAEACLCWMRK